MLAFQTPTTAPKWKRLFIYSPLARIVIFLLVFSLLMFLLSVLFISIGWHGKVAPEPQRFAGIFIRQLVPALAAYLFLVYVVERRKPAELAWAKVVPHGLVGLIAGVLFISSVVGVMWLAGSYEVSSTNPHVDWLKPLLLAGLGTAIAEEIIFRGILFRISEEGLGTWPALLISALFFGAVHIMNKGATVWSSVAITIEAGVLLGLAYHISRSLPLVMGIHMAWNFTQGAVYGIPVSGTTDPGFLISNRPGPEWLSGGVFGAEASVVAVAISLAASVAMAVYAHRQGSIFVRKWRARPIMDSTSSSSQAA